MSDGSVHDDTLPVLDSISISDNEIDQAAGENSFTINVSASDTQSEIASIKVTVSGPEDFTISQTLNTASGSLTFDVTETFPAGNYRISEVVVTDAAGNARVYDGPNLSSLIETSVEVVGTEVDLTPPEIVNIYVEDPVVDFSTDDRTVTIHADITDNLAGVEVIRISLYSIDDGKSLGQISDTEWANYDGGLDGVFTLTLPDHLSNGTYSLHVTARDAADNDVFFDHNDLAALGFNTIIEVINSDEDVTAPELVSLNIADPVVDMSTGDQQFTINYEFSDDFSGIEYLEFGIHSETGQVLFITPDNDESGSLTVTIPEYFANGEYTLHYYVRDAAQNVKAANIPSSDTNIVVSNANPDTEVPELVNFEVADPYIDLNTGDRRVTINVELSDSYSGLENYSVYLIAPTGQTTGAYRPGDVTGPLTLYIPEHFGSGEYTLEVRGQDYAQNKFVYTYEDIVEAGFTAGFTITDDDTPTDEDPADDQTGGDTTPPDDDDDDHDNGHGNDEDGVDESNPGNSEGSNGGGNGNGNGGGNGNDRDDNGHGNDEDGVDESNPGNSTGTNRRLKGSDQNDTITGTDEADTITGGDGDDDLEAGDGDDQVWAGPTDTGNDKVAGGRGNDAIGGGKGNDLIVGGNRRKGADDSDDDGSDSLYGGEGDDTVIGGSWTDSSGDGAFTFGEEATEGLGANRLWGGQGDDLIIGADGDDTVGGGSGSDRVYAGGGNDKVFGGRSGPDGSNDTIDGGAGDDVIYAGDGEDNVLGGDGDDDLYSGAGNDTVDGGDGQDTIWGGGGDDRFTGGSGADVFIFGASAGNDTVTDFNVAEDQLWLTSTVTDFTDAASVAAASTEITVSGQSGLLIDTGGGNSVFLAGLTTADLSSANLVLD